MCKSKKHIKEQKDFYPFGKEHENPNLITSTNRYTFSGKEKQTVRDLGWLDFTARMYANSEIPMFTTQDPLAEKYYSLSPYMYCAGNPLRYVDPNGMDVYRYDDKTVDFMLYKKTDDNFDQVGKFKYDKKTGEYTLKTNKKGEAKTSIDNIEKGILSDGINFKENNNIIAVGGEGQATEKGVENFVLKLSDMVGKEIGGAYFSKDGAKSTTHISIGYYSANSYTHNRTHGHNLWHSLFLNSKLENSLTGFFHTHPSIGYSVSDRTRASDQDKMSRDKALAKMPFLKFYILTHPINYGDKFPYRIDYTTE